MRMALKELFLGQRELRRRLEVPTRPDGADVVELHGPKRSTQPRVSVVLTVYDYVDTVGEAIASVALAEPLEAELIVVDDASNDGSLAAVRTALTEHPWLSATLIARGRNAGLAAARNLGVQHAGAEYVFILDADNGIYPRCLSLLANALDGNPDAAFAYGLLEVFDSRGPRDLMSWLAWDPIRLRYGNFIDAMAMIRRSALLETGGYSSDPRLYGWEDFALWCAFGDRGWRGVLVPEIVARYRRGLQSMITLTDIDASSAWAALAERYSVLTA
jgi:glycosyltransferase involved in cell wall biosynthesis